MQVLIYHQSDEVAFSIVDLSFLAASLEGQGSSFFRGRFTSCAAKSSVVLEFKFVSKRTWDEFVNLQLSHAFHNRIEMPHER